MHAQTVVCIVEPRRLDVIVFPGIELVRCRYRGRRLCQRPVLGDVEDVFGESYLHVLNGYGLLARGPMGGWIGQRYYQQLCVDHEGMESSNPPSWTRFALVPHRYLVEPLPYGARAYYFGLDWLAHSDPGAVLFGDDPEPTYRMGTMWLRDGVGPPASGETPT